MRSVTLRRKWSLRCDNFAKSRHRKLTFEKPWLKKAGRSIAGPLPLSFAIAAWKIACRFENPSRLETCSRFLGPASADIPKKSVSYLHRLISLAPSFVPLLGTLSLHKFSNLLFFSLFSPLFLFSSLSLASDIQRKRSPNREEVGGDRFLHVTIKSELRDYIKK